MQDLSHTASMVVAAVDHAAQECKDEFPRAVTTILEADTVIFSGMGKSGYIAQKAASTFRSLGKPSHYVHPGDASHGDLGALNARTALVILSNSGETPELADLIHYARENLLPTIGIMGRSDSTLAEAVLVPLCYGRVREACPNGLAPTTSTTVAMVVCDALANAYARAAHVSPNDFHKYHPGGKLGTRLRKVRDIMHTPPTVRETDRLLHAASVMTGTVAGVALVTGSTGCVGVLTDGDLRRAIQTDWGMVKQAMSKNPITITETATAEQALEAMHHNRITKIFVEDALGSIVGVVNMHDC